MAGLVGGLVAMGLSLLMRHRLAEVHRGRVIADLVQEYRWHIRAVGFTLLGAIVTAIVAYSRGWASNHDWRPLALAFGGGTVVPVAVIRCHLSRARFAEFWVALAAKESAAPWVASLFFILFVTLFIGSLAAYLLK